MIEVENIISGFQTAESRWSRFGPYYAMFPLDFAFDVVEKYSSEGDYIIDPFAGRGSSIFAGGVLGRSSLGIEINPVGWLYGAVKLQPAEKDKVLSRLEEVYSKRNYFSRTAKKMPTFFKMCYCNEVLKFLLAARKYLDWKTDSIDATLMSILLVYLHGKLGQGLSNQMKKSKAMGINYSIKWWKDNDMATPPEIDPLDYLTGRIEWRYKKGIPEVHNSRIIWGDSANELDEVIDKANETGIKFSLLFTSPPYCSVTNYYADQWLRLWLLGGPPKPKARDDKHKGRFVSKENYYDLLDTVFGNSSSLMAEKSTIYVRTDKRKFTFNSTVEVLEKHFPSHNLEIVDQSYEKKNQTQIHGNKSNTKGEIDIILRS